MIDPSPPVKSPDQPTATPVDFIEPGKLRATPGELLVIPYVEKGNSRDNKQFST